MDAEELKAIKDKKNAKADIENEACNKRNKKVNEKANNNNKSSGKIQSQIDNANQNPEIEAKMAEDNI